MSDLGRRDREMQRDRYKNPPIEEALIEFRFVPSQEWDLTMPGRLHMELRGAYPGKPRQQNLVQAALVAQPGLGPNVQVREGLAKVQLVTEDGTRLVAIGPDVLSVHVLRPYQRDSGASGWDEFRPRIVEALSRYWGVAEPRGVARVGLRYINKITIPEATVDVTRYLRAAPPRVEGLPEQLSGFVGRVEYLCPGDVRLVVSHATVDAPPDHVAFLVDIDLITNSDDVMDLEGALEKADELRARERVVFEALITDDTRRLFDAAR
jgi:uncharacterized protein (TIGR04255 family)